MESIHVREAWEESGWTSSGAGSCPSRFYPHTGSRKRKQVRDKGKKHSKLILNRTLPPAMLHPLKAPQPRDKSVEYVSLWETCFHSHHNEPCAEDKDKLLASLGFN